MKNMLAAFRRKFSCNQELSKVWLSNLPRTSCDTSNLGSYNRHFIVETFNCDRTAQEWAEDSLRIDSLNIPDMTGGVNPGDRRALYYLVRRLKPLRFLEIGTHIGSSTVALTLAAARNQADGVDTRIVSVDIYDVNDQVLKPWEESGSPDSPWALLAALGLNHLVTFEVNAAVNSLALSTDLFDIIFLDGDHCAEAVYSEIPLALKRLRGNGKGAIVLHDYFPNLQPLWVGQAPLSGPFQAVERFLSEGAEFHIMPLGKLPWPTKLGSCITSLAMLSKYP